MARETRPHAISADERARIVAALRGRPHALDEIAQEFGRCAITVRRIRASANILRTPWTCAERRRAEALRREGLSYKGISKAGINRTADAIASALRSLRLQQRDSVR